MRVRPVPAIVIAALGAALVAVPALDMPAFYVSFLYIVFIWISLSTSWAILSRAMPAIGASATPRSSASASMPRRPWRRSWACRSC